jgi:son of sevenless
LSDFGLSKVLMLKGMSTTAEVTGSVRWMSPELLNGDIEIANTKSDVWAYGMTILASSVSFCDLLSLTFQFQEIMSGHVPYNEVTNDAAVMLRITLGHMPSRPGDSGIADDVWGICEKCWHIDPEQRPSMHDVFLEVASLVDMPLSGTDTGVPQHPQQNWKASFDSTLLHGSDSTSPQAGASRPEAVCDLHPDALER